VTVPNETTEAARPAAVYRLYDADGALLYIGSAYDPAHRSLDHRGTEWWPRVARRKDEWHPGRSEAYIAETAAIWRERPEANVKSTAAYARECRERGARDRLKARVAQDASQLREKVAAEARTAGADMYTATAIGMLAERAYKEESGAFPNGVAYPPMDYIRHWFAQGTTASE
jgi:hypothetical protein